MNAPKPTKRRKFSDHEDVMLLRQVNAERPFEARHGEVMKVWASIAQKLDDDGEFDRPGFDSKKAQHRFDVLLKHHRAFDRESMLASGIDQNYDEKLQLLDELLSAVDDSIMQDKERAETAISDSQREESEGERIRNKALSSLGKRKKTEEENDGNSTGGGRLIKLTTSMQEDNKADLELRRSDLEFRKYQFETELAEREKDRIEREKDRAFAMEQSRQQHATIMAMLEMMSRK
ncbi:hypothetical protein AC1031_019014 [Aphanomyces cochlioides]|nr:hypothetical protein AC1031_019014 [Aphanomyces cochlioides]